MSVGGRRNQERKSRRPAVDFYEKLFFQVENFQVEKKQTVPCDPLFRKDLALLLLFLCESSMDDHLSKIFEELLKYLHQ
jgi:uncharacterized protein with von Willebrand factor type A (vWA) domain